MAAGAVQLQGTCQRQYSSRGRNSHLLSMEIFVSPMWDGPQAFCSYCVLGLEVSQQAVLFVTSQLSLQMQAYLDNAPFRSRFSLICKVTNRTCTPARPLTYTKSKLRGFGM